MDIASRSKSHTVKLTPHSKKIVMAQKRALESHQDIIARRLADKSAKTFKRALESEKGCIIRKEADKIAKSRKRALESEQDAMNTKEADKIAKSGKRALEYEQDAMNRKQADKITKSRKRALESDEDAVIRKQIAKCAKKAKRSTTVLIDEAIGSFCSIVTSGPEFVCTVCHGLMYQNSVVSCRSDNYAEKLDRKMFNELFPEDFQYTSFDGNK